MSKKKINPMEGMTYKPQVDELYTPTKWEPGEWLTDENGKPYYTGKPIKEFAGYQVVMYGYLDGKKYSSIQPLTKVTIDGNYMTILMTLDDVSVPFDPSQYKPGDMFTPFIKRYPSGEIMDYELPGIS